MCHHDVQIHTVTLYTRNTKTMISYQYILILRVCVCVCVCVCLSLCAQACILWILLWKFVGCSELGWPVRGSIVSDTCCNLTAAACLLLWFLSRTLPNPAGSPCTKRTRLPAWSQHLQLSNANLLFCSASEIYVHENAVKGNDCLWILLLPRIFLKATPLLQLLLQWCWSSQ